MLATPVVKVAKSIFFILASVVSLIGLIFLLSAAHEYASGDTADAVPFTQITFGLTCLCSPMAVYFSYRSRKSSHRKLGIYNVPDPPIRSVLYVILAAGFSIATLIFSILFITGISF